MIDHPDVVTSYLEAEISESRVVGPLPRHIIPQAHIGRFGVIPKSHEPGKWRLIVDLSYPAERSINDVIPKSLCSMTYITVGESSKVGPGALLAKIDIRNVFRLPPVHPDDRHLLAMEWKGNLYIDACLPFGLRSAPKLFNIVADTLVWNLENQEAMFILHYVDNYLTVGQPDSPESANNHTGVREFLNIPLALEKIEGPATTLEFLGSLLDTVHMEARLPLEKLRRIISEVNLWLDKRSATKRQILSLVGLLQHAAKVVHPGRTFVGRMYSVAAKVKRLDFITRLNNEFCSDLFW